MAIKGKIKRWEWEIGGEKYELFAKDGQIEPLLDGLTDLGRLNPAPQQVSVGGFSRARYPKGPKRAVSGFTRTTLLGQPSNWASLPGRNATLERKIGEDDLEKVKTVTVSFTGPFTQFYTYVLANAKVAMTLRSPDGTPYEITLSAPPAG